MFLIRFLRWLFGWVRLTAEGGFPERLLNLAAREEIQLWGICRQGITLTACCRAKDYKRLRQPARKACMRMRVRERHGAPFFLRRYHARAGIAVGLAAYILLLHFFSQRIWAIDVIGNEKLSDREILSVLEPMGVELGKISENLDIPNIQLIALQKIPDVAWLAVNLSGSVARVEVKERTLPPTPTDPNRPSNIRAARDGRIIEFSVYGGEAAVQNGDAVTEGMLLVSGVIEGEKGTILRRSQAKIIAETNRELEVRVPLKETRLLPTGRTIFRPTLNFFTLSIPWYTDGPIDSEYSLEESQHPLMAGRPAHATLHHQPPVYSHGTCRDRPNRAGGRRAGRKAARPKGAGGAGQRPDHRFPVSGGDGRRLLRPAGRLSVHRGHRRGGTDPTGLSIADNCHGHNGIAGEIFVCIAP